MSGGIPDAGMKDGIGRCPDVETSSDGYAHRFAGPAGRFFLDRQEALVRQALAGMQTSTLLDVGGGHGQLSGPLAAAGWAVTVVGSTPGCADRLAHDGRNLHTRFIDGDLLELPFEAKSFDAALSVRTMAHIEDWPRFIGELCRVARDRVVIDYPELMSLNLLSLASFGLKRRIEGDTRRFRTFRRQAIVAVFERHGFRLRSARGQFVLPMARHRAASGAAPLRAAETAFARIGLTDRFGNPGILCAERVD
jgi:SAM-dependent methyltransferase